MNDGGEPLLEIAFEAQVFYWRGPSPFLYAAVPPAGVEQLGRVARIVSYGWGMIPVEARVGGASFKTALFPKEGAYLLPLKIAVRRKANITAGDQIAVELTVRPPTRRRGL